MDKLDAALVALKSERDKALNTVVSKLKSSQFNALVEDAALLQVFVDVLPQSNFKVVPFSQYTDLHTSMHDLLRLLKQRHAELQSALQVHEAAEGTHRQDGDNSVSDTLGLSLATARNSLWNGTFLPCTALWVWSPECYGA